MNMAQDGRFQHKTRAILLALAGLTMMVSAGCREAQQAKVSAGRTGAAVQQWYDHARDRVTGRTDPRIIPEPAPQVID